MADQSQAFVSTAFESKMFFQIGKHPAAMLNEVSPTTCAVVDSLEGRAFATTSPKEL